MVVEHRRLTGVRAIRLEQYITAAYCTTLLGGVGAEVTKMKMPVRGEPYSSIPS